MNRLDKIGVCFHLVDRAMDDDIPAGFIKGNRPGQRMRAIEQRKADTVADLFTSHVERTPETVNAGLVFTVRVNGIDGITQHRQIMDGQYTLQAVCIQVGGMYFTKELHDAALNISDSGQRDAFKAVLQHLIQSFVVPYFMYCLVIHSKQ